MLSTSRCLSVSLWGFFLETKSLSACFASFCVSGFFPVHVVPGGATRRSARTQLQWPENKESVRVCFSVTIAGDRPWSQRQRHTGLLCVCLKRYESKSLRLPKNHIQAEKMTTWHSCSLKRFLYKFKCNFIITQI